MKKVTFTLKSGKPITFFIGAATLAIHPSELITTERDDNRNIYKTATGAVINDGIHNNGGWVVLESYEEVIARISIAVGDYS